MIGAQDSSSYLKALGIDEWVPIKALQAESVQYASVSTGLVLIVASHHREARRAINQLLKNILYFLQLKLDNCDILYSREGLYKTDHMLGQYPRRVIGFGKGTLSACGLHASDQAITTLGLLEVMAKPELKKRLLMDIYEFKNTNVNNG